MSEHVFDKARWQSQTIFYQMGNIGSEVGRALAARRRGDAVSMKAAFYRGLDLIDATAEKLAAEKSPRLKEVLRAQEQFAAAIEFDDDLKIEAYFMDFALAARNGL